MGNSFLVKVLNNFEQKLELSYTYRDPVVLGIQVRCWQEIWSVV